MITRDSVVVGQTKPDLTLDQWTTILESASSPALVEAPQCYRAVTTLGLSPAFVLSIFMQESGMGTAGFATVNKSPGNTRTSVTGIGMAVTTVKGVLIRYPNWYEGFRDLAWRLVAPKYIYALEGRRTIAQIIYRWSPPEDKNDTEGYIRSVVSNMSKWITAATAIGEGSNMGQTPPQFLIKWVGTNGNNFWSGREGESVVAICDHIMQGTMESSDGWFKNSQSEVSAHFGVAKDGRIWQWVDMNNRAWANGIPENPDTSVPFIADAIQRKKNPNDFTVSIEHEGNTGDPMPETQYQATLWLHKFIMSQFPIITPDRNHIVGHYQISAKSRPNCPGTGFPWNRLIKDLAAGGINHVTENNNNQGAAPAALPYGVTVDQAGAFIFPGNIPLNFGFKDSFLTLFGNVPVGDDLGAAIIRAVKQYGLPVKPEEVTPSGSQQEFENCFFSYNKNEAPGWQLRLSKKSLAA